MTDRNRQFLRQFTPVTQAQPGPRPNFVDLEPQVNLPQNPVPVVSDPEPVVSVPEPVVSVPVPQTPTPSPQVAQPTTPGSPSFVTPPSTPVATTPPRRSTRVRKPPVRFGYDEF